MSENNDQKCPYCGGSFVQEEGGYRCGFCKSFFPFEAEQVEKKEEPYKLSLLRPQIVEDPEKGIDKKMVEEEKSFHRLKSRNELIGLSTAFVSAVFMVLCKLLKMPLLMIPGFVFWVFSAAFTIYQIVKTPKERQRTYYIRVLAMLALAILMLFFIRPSA